MRLHGGSRYLGYGVDEQPGFLMRAFLWLVRELGGEVVETRPVRIFYKFDSGRWRSRSTSQFHKVNRCR